MPFSSKTTQESFRGRCVKRFFLPNKKWTQSALPRRSAPRTQAHLGATRPRVGIANLGFDAPSWQYLN